MECASRARQRERALRAGCLLVALGVAVTAAVVKAVPKTLSMSALQGVLAKVHSPPARAVHTIVPVGLLGAAAASLPGAASAEVIVNTLVTL